MNFIVTALAIISQFASSATVTQITSIVSFLEQIIPVLIKEYQDVAPMIKNIIMALKSNGNIDPSMVLQLQALDKKVDEEFEAAATAAQMEDDAQADNELVQEPKPVI